MQIDHLAIWTSDLERIKNFYMMYFDCTCNDKYINEKKQFSSYFLTFSNGFRIELMKSADINEQTKSNAIGLSHFAIKVGTKAMVDSLTKKLHNDGYTIESQPRTTGDGYYESVILDPEKNKVELTAMNDFAISRANINDLKSILYLQKCCYLSEAELVNNYNIPPITQSIGEITAEFNNQLFLKLEYQNKIIGSVRAYEKEGTCYIGKLIVNAEFQNMGFGRLLLNALEHEFIHAKRFELFTSNKSERNLHLYKKLGYADFRKEAMGDLPLIYLQKFKQFLNLGEN